MVGNIPQDVWSAECTLGDSWTFHYIFQCATCCGVVTGVSSIYVSEVVYISIDNKYTVKHLVSGDFQFLGYGKSVNILFMLVTLFSWASFGVLWPS